MLRSSPRPTSASDSSRIYIPLLNIRRKDVTIRPELLALLPYANIDASNLITLDDLSEAPRSGNPGLAPENTRWILVDHNALQGELGKQYSDRVVGCIDHHDDEGKIPIETGDEPRIIEKCGSCMSLVVKHCRKYWSDLTSSALMSGASHDQDDSSVGCEDASMRKAWNAQVAKLALASIVIDTSNLTSRDKTKEIDTDAVKYLRTLIDMDPPTAPASFDQEKLFQEISKAKQDLDSLKLADILRKDYKQWTQREGKFLGISSVVKPLSYMVEKAGSEVDGTSPSAEAFRICIQNFAKERDLGVYAIMTTSKSSTGEFQRELLIWVLDSALKSLKHKIAQEAVETLGLEEWKENQDLDEMQTSSQSDVPMQIWWQRKVENSRKQVGPLLRKMIG